MRLRIVLACTLSLGLGVMAGSARAVEAATVTVCPAGPPLCQYDNVRVAVDSAASGDTVSIAAGRYVLQRVLVSSGRNITIVGAGAGRTIVDAAGARVPVVVVSPNATVSLRGVTLTGSGGYALGGGGVLNAGDLTISDTTITGNTAGETGDGGGIANYGTLMLINSVVSGNSAGQFGGGICNGTCVKQSVVGATLTLIHTTVSHNRATFGGGIYDVGSSGGKRVTLTDSAVTRNSAGEGGGMFTAGSDAVGLTRTAITWNHAVDGGGIFSASHMLLTRSFIVENVATDKGGGINGGQERLVHSVVLANTCLGGPGCGGGVKGAEVQREYSAIAGNRPDDITG